MEENLKNYLQQISNATLEISQSPKEYLDLLSKSINATFYFESTNSKA